MRPWTHASTAVLVTVIVAGAFACDRREPPGERVPGQTRTRSGELNGEPRRHGERPLGERDDRDRSERDRDERDRNDDRASADRASDAGARAVRDAGAARARDAAAEDPRLDAGRLSIVGSAEERERNLGLVREPAIVPVAPVEGVEGAPGQERDAGPVERPVPPPTPEPPTRREGAGRPGAAGDPYQ